MKPNFEIKFLGTGSAFTLGDDNYQSNMLITNKSTGRRLLIDCGTDIRFSLAEAGLKLSDLTDIYISHLHADHIGGLEGVAFSTFFNPAIPRPNLYLSEDMVGELWAGSLSGGLRSLEGQICTLDTYFDVHGIGPNGFFEWEGVKFQLVQVVHFMDGFRIVPSYGLLFNLNGKNVFITTDTQFCPRQIEKFYNMSDVIFHDAETSPFKSGVHAHYTDLRTLSESHKAKMYLYHYQPGEKPDCTKDGFGGWAVKGQTFDF